MAIPTTTNSKTFIARLTAFRERFGTNGALLKAFDVLLHKLLRISSFTVVWLDVKSLAPLPAPGPEFQFRFLTADEIARFAEDPAYYLDSVLAERVREGREVCYAALAGDRLAAFGFYALHYIEPQRASGVAMSFPNDVAFMTFGLTHPDFRGARLHGHIMGRALQELADRGITKFASLVARANLASLKSCYRLGYTSLGNMMIIGGKRRSLGVYPNAAKQHGIRFGRHAQQNEY
jgi:GNAT superfamily N-acetyltransferase